MPGAERLPPRANLGPASPEFKPPQLHVAFPAGRDHPGQLQGRRRPALVLETGVEPDVGRTGRTSARLDDPLLGDDAAKELAVSFGVPVARIVDDSRHVNACVDVRPLRLAGGRARRYLVVGRLRTAGRIG